MNLAVILQTERYHLPLVALVLAPLVATAGGAATPLGPGSPVGSMSPGAVMSVHGAPKVQADSSGDDFFLQAAGHVSGVGGVDWVQTINVLNETANPATLDMTYYPRGWGETPIEHTITIPGATEAEFFDPIGDWFGVDQGVGSVVIDVADKEAAEVFITSKFEGVNPDGSAYGQAFPAVPMDAGITGEAYIFTTVDAQTNRVNLGLAAMAPGTSFTAEVLDDGAVEGTKTYTGWPLGHNDQESDIFTKFGTGPIDDAVVKITVDSGMVGAYISDIDNGTNDPTSRSAMEFNDELVISAIGSIPGVGVDWASKLGIVDGGTGAIVDAEYYDRGGQSGVTATTDMTLGQWQSVGYNDAAGELFGVTNGVGTLRLVADGPIAADGQFYAILDEGTAGQRIPAFTEPNMVADSTYRVTGLHQSQDYDLDKSRANVLGFSLTGANLHVETYDGSTGVLEDTDVLPIPAGEYAQMNAFMDVDDADSKFVKTWVNTGEAYVVFSQTNQSDDPTIKPPVLYEEPDEGELTVTAQLMNYVLPIVDTDDNYRVTITVEDTRPTGEPFNIQWDYDGDSQYHSSNDQTIQVTSNPFTAEFVIPYGGEFNGEQFDRHLKVRGYLDGGTYTYENSFPLFVETMGALDKAWVSDAEDWQHVRNWFWNNRTELLPLLTQGDPDCAWDEDQIMDDFYNASAWQNGRLMMNDDGNSMRIENDTSGLTMGCVYDQPFDQAINLMGQSGYFGENAGGTPVLDVIVDAATTTDPIRETTYVTVNAVEPRTGGEITSICIDNDEDLACYSAIDELFTYDPGQSSQSETAGTIFMGDRSGDDINRSVIVWSEYTDSAGRRISDSQTIDAPLHVNRVSDLEGDWRTDPTRSAEVINFFQQNKQQIADSLSHGNPQCADSVEEYIEFIDIATGFPDIYFNLLDHQNVLSAWSEAAQEGGTMGCVYEANFDHVLEMAAPYLIDNPDSPY